MRGRPARIRSLGALLVLAGAVLSAADLPRVRLIATGGTISNRTGGRLTAEELVNSIPDLKNVVRADWEQFSNVASAQLTLDQWLKLAKRINAAFDHEPDLAGLVVTSGTDTLEELAYFLDLTVHHDRPVVVVGSMRNPSTLGYEGAANLLQGFRVAADPAARGKGVLVVLNDEINAAREVTKTDAVRLDTFESRPYGVLGVVDRDRVVFYRDVLKRHTTRSEFDISTLEELPRVDVLLTYQGAPGDLIKASVDGGAKGIVVAGAGTGATSGTQDAAVTQAWQQGVVVVTSSRSGSGRVAPRAQTTANNATTPRRPFVGAEDLAPIKARILLMLALTKTKDPVEIQRIFSEY
jgi:L-asparaginase